MLKIKNLTVTDNKGRILVRDFSFVLNKGDKIALIGEEGNGKSTLLKIMAGIDVSSYASYTGKVERKGTVGYLPQHLSDEQLEMNVEDFISTEIDYNLLYQAFNRALISYEIYEGRKMATLSGGERVKISLLRILYHDPDIILMDEPTNDLDLKTLIWLEEFILNCDLPLIFVSHDETLLENCANGILHIEQLKRKTEAHLTYSGQNYREYIESRNAFIGRNNMIASKEKAQFRKQLEKWRRIYQKVEHQQRTITRQDPHGGKMLKKKMHTVKAQERQLEEKKKDLTEKYEAEEAINIFFDQIDINPNKVILDLHLDELCVSGKTLSHDIDLYVSGKDKICIIGDNGTGKSTLIKIIRDLLKERNDIKLGYMPQNYDEVLDYDSDVIAYLWDGRKKDDLSMIRSYLGALRFTTEEMEHPIRELSDGQKCKVLLMKLIIGHCDVLLLDEPTRNLSPLSGPKVRQILNEFKGCIISVSHDRKFIEEVAETLYRLSTDGLVKID